MMPDPDFDQIARQVIMASDNAWTTSSRQRDLTLVPHVAEQLRQVWNARGAADLSSVEPLQRYHFEDEQFFDKNEYGVYVNVDAVLATLKKLDR